MAKSYFLQDSSIGELVRKIESDFTSRPTTISKYVEIDVSEDINRIYAYLNSKHIHGKFDSLDREKPFFNVVIAARNIWFRATDIDRSKFRVRGTKSQDDIGAFLANVHLWDWMRRENFGSFLNNVGLNCASFNETVTKWVEQDGRLVPIFVPWNKMLFDAVDFAGNPKVEILELTEAQLYKRKGYDKELVKKLCDAREARETVEGNKIDNKDNYIKLYEIHGVFPLSYITFKEEDQYEYVQQMHVITFIARKDEQGKTCHDDYTLYCGREDQDPYLIISLLPEPDGSIGLNGAVKNLFDTQWMENHTAKAIKDQLDLATRTLFQTADKTFLGQNILTALEVGDILIHETNQPLTQVASNPTGIAPAQSYGAMWKQLGNEIVGISESMLGQSAPSGTAWRQVDALLQENHSLFEVMTENKALGFETAMRRFVIPFLKKKMDTSDEISATLNAHDIQKIDARYIKNSSIRKAKKAVKERLLNGQEVTPEQQQAFTAMFAGVAKDNLDSQGNQRFFAPSEITTKQWKDVLKDLEWDVEIDLSGENVDREAMTTLNTLLQIVTDPVRAQAIKTGRGRLIADKILQLSGTVSPVELSSVPEEPQVPNVPQRGMQPAPAGGSAVVQ